MSIAQKAKKIAAEAAKKLLCTARRGILAVNGDDGYPYAVPINYLYEEATETICFHGARAGHKFDALRSDDKVCFTVYGNETVKEEPWAPFLQSVVVFGRCRPVQNDAEAAVLLKRLAMKYYPQERLAEEEIARAGKAAQVFIIGLSISAAKRCRKNKSSAFPTAYYNAVPFFGT